jgi:CRP/FNR family transcriptional regulator, cyclic AMP receptor protein
MITVDRIAFLQNVPLFAGMTSQELMDVSEIVKEVTFPSDTTIIREDDIGDYMFILVDGEVMIHRRNVQIGKLRSRDFFGEISILDRGPRCASVTTLSHCQLMRIDQRDFWQMLVDRNNLAVSMVRALAQRLRQMLLTSV